MRSICIPHTELPGTSKLFGDYLYRFSRVAGFYDHDPHDPDAVRRVAAGMRFPEGRRQRVVDALRELNGDSAALAMLELPETVAVVTGQQVGLFGGPAYTIYKALTAAKLARRLTEAGIRAVPVFWLATEDHDFEEIRKVQVFDAGTRVRRLEADGQRQPGQPVGTIELSGAPVVELTESLAGFLHGDDVASVVEEAYQPGLTYGEAFRRLLHRLLAGYGLVFLDPMMPEIRAAAAPFLRDAFERRNELCAAVRNRGRQLEAAGYHTQVLFEEKSSLFFRLEQGRRLPVGNGDVEELMLAKPESLSPNALLRPVLQDYLLPTVAYVGGPAELAYLAQSQPLYRALLGRMPVAVPRSAFTLLDDRAHGLLDRHHVSLIDCFHGEEALRDRIAARLIPEELHIGFEDTVSDVRNAVDKLLGPIERFDPTLGEAWKKSREKILYQLEKNRRKTAREALRRQTQVSSAASHLSTLVYPDHHLQERAYSILPFLARHGLDLIDRLYDRIHEGCPDHLVTTI
jgi:bacillithiol biosynthesis cysteine-adding enzyme BshC